MLPRLCRWERTGQGLPAQGWRARGGAGGHAGSWAPPYRHLPGGSVLPARCRGQRVPRLTWLPPCPTARSIPRTCKRSRIGAGRFAADSIAPSSAFGEAQKLPSRTAACRPTTVMVGGGRPSTTSPSWPQQSRGWSAFADHDGTEQRASRRAAVILGRRLIRHRSTRSVSSASTPPASPVANVFACSPGGSTGIMATIISVRWPISIPATSTAST